MTDSLSLMVSVASSRAACLLRHLMIGAVFFRW